MHAPPPARSAAAAACTERPAERREPRVGLRTETRSLRRSGFPLSGFRSRSRSSRSRSRARSGSRRGCPTRRGSPPDAAFRARVAMQQCAVAAAPCPVCAPIARISPTAGRRRPPRTGRPSASRRTRPRAGARHEPQRRAAGRSSRRAARGSATDRRGAPGRGRRPRRAPPAPRERPATPGRGPAAGVDRDEVAVRRVPSAPGAPAPPRRIRRRRDVAMRDRPRVGLERLDEDASGRVAAAPAGELGDELERALLGAEVRRPKTCPRRRGRERHAAEMVTLRDDLRAEEDRRRSVAGETTRAPARQIGRVALSRPSRRGRARARETRGRVPRSRCCVRPRAAQVGRPAGRTRCRNRLACGRSGDTAGSPSLQHERDVAVATPDRRPHRLGNGARVRCRAG